MTTSLNTWLVGLGSALLLASTFAQPATTAAEAATPKPRPRIGLVLSGGGARGLAHIGVLKVLERERIPIDVIAGTSMGAIIGGLYASGLPAQTLERELLEVDWTRLFAHRVDRQELSQRRKEEDFDVSPLIELGMRNGELRTPIAAVSSRGLETLLRRFTLPVRHLKHFDALPIPFRAVATDMETGRAVILADGDLALAMRSSMSVPGVFSPLEVGGRILGDGGLVNNVPVDVARAMGADVVIVVNIGTPIGSRETLGSLLGVTSQMINILTEQNVQRSLDTLREGDLLVAPALGKLSSGDFDKAARLIALGEQGADAALNRLRAVALTPEAYAQWRAEPAGPRRPAPTVTAIRFEGSTLTQPQRLQPRFESQVGEPFDVDKAERDARKLAASGDYLRADYHLERRGDSEELVFSLEDKPWGPHYFRLGLDLSTEFNGRSAFNIKISHNRHWLTPSGTEWRNRLHIGSAPGFLTEIYHPMTWSSKPSDDWFVSGYGAVERRALTLFDADSGVELARFRRSTSVVGLDLGQPWGRFGEFRFGPTWRGARTSPDSLSTSFVGSQQTTKQSEVGLRARAVVDQLDYANFPQSGFRIESEAGLADTNDVGRNERVELRGTAAWSLGRHTLNLHGAVQAVRTAEVPVVGRYALGGFHQLSGYRQYQLNGNATLFSRLTWYSRLEQVPALTRGVFVGATLEAGNAWLKHSDARPGDLRLGSSLFVGADTGIGPVYLGVGYAPRGSSTLSLFIGRP